LTAVAICGGSELRSTCELLGLQPAISMPRLVMVDLRVDGAAAQAAVYPADIPRIVIATADQAALLRAFGGDRLLVARSDDAAAVGPLVARALPGAIPGRTRVVTVAAARGGTGRTLCVANLARRLAADRTVIAIDATGTGALGWWLGVDPRPWSELEALAGELRAEHLELVMAAAAPRLSVVGGPPTAPSSDGLATTIAVARELADVVLVDPPTFADERSRVATAASDRVLVLSYGDAASRAALASADVPAGAWVIGSQGSLDDAFRVFPRDDDAVADALAQRGRIGGALGRAYDELAELIAIDAT
jgi:hypothetical protein